MNSELDASVQGSRRLIDEVVGGVVECSISVRTSLKEYQAPRTLYQDHAPYGSTYIQANLRVQTPRRSPTFSWEHWKQNRNLSYDAEGVSSIY